MLSLWNGVLSFWQKWVTTEEGLNVGYWLGAVVFILLVVFALGWLEARRLKIKGKGRIDSIYVIGGKRGSKSQK